MAAAVKTKRRGDRSSTAPVNRGGLAFRFLNNERGIVVPSWIVNHDSYRRWATSDEFPNIGWISYLDGIFWADVSREQIRHNLMKGEFGSQLTSLTDKDESGYFMGDNMLITNVKAGLSTEPDGSFFSSEALRTGRVVLPDGDKSLEILGSLDMVLEVVSPTSVDKDTMILPRLYSRSGVREYWLVDPRGEDVTFDIFKNGPKGYVATPKRNGWIKSEVFGKLFRLSRSVGTDELSDYRLEVR